MLSYIRQRISWKFFGLTTIFLVTVFAVLFLFLSQKQEALILEQVEKQAIILHRQIVLTRKWVSDHGYILVAGGAADHAGSSSKGDPLEKISGEVYTRITPAALTRQLSDHASRNRLYSFNLTNFNGINPENIPDQFEARAISEFRSGRSTAVSQIETKQGRYLFRYAAPLIIEESCLKCHNDGRFKVGDIGGCISVLIPFDETRAAIRADNISLFLGMTGLTASVILVLFFFAQRLIFRPIRDIRSATSRLKAEAFLGAGPATGDELKEFSGLCGLMDQKLKDQHHELARKITAATKDLHLTNQALETANLQMRAMNQAKSEFFTDISHELRTPLTAIKGAVDLLTRKAVCSETNYIDIIRKNTEHLTRTIMDFLDYSKIEFGRLELDLADHAMGGIVREVIAAQTVMSQKKAIQIHLHEKEEMTVAMDRYRIYQVISNLVANALKFSPSNGLVEIAIIRNPTGVRVGVSDQGPGIALKYRERVFQKYFQVPGPSTQKNGGSGIGLAICKGLVEAHGGRIWVESRPGHGCTFYFNLPLSPDMA